MPVAPKPSPSVPPRRGPTRSGVAAALAAALLVALPQDAPAPKDPAPTTPWHAEPVLERCVVKNVAVYNHADATLETATVAALAQKQFEFLEKYTGGAPRWVLVHVGNKYECGFSIQAGPDPEMFLQAPGIFDTSANYAHEMMHCFMFELGTLPHWFNESLSDMAWFDSELELWKRRKESWLDGFDRADYRSYELLQLRRKYGREYFRRVCAELRKRKDECRRVFTDATKLDEKNELILTVLSTAAGEDVRPLFKEWGFNPRTRERQRGY